MQEVVLVVACLSVPLIAIEMVATVVGRVRVPLFKRLFAAGTIDAIGASAPLVSSLSYPVLGVEPSEIVLIVLSVFGAALIR